MATPMLPTHSLPSYESRPRTRALCPWPPVPVIVADVCETEDWEIHTPMLLSMYVRVGASKTSPVPPVPMRLMLDAPTVAPFMMTTPALWAPRLFLLPPVPVILTAPTVP